MPEPRILRAVRLSQAGVEQVQQLANAEKRSWSAMLRILLSEALAARAKAQPKKRTGK